MNESCPDCDTPLSSKTPNKCRCGWLRPGARSHLGDDDLHRVHCDTTSCGEVAFIRENDRNLCRRCFEGQGNTEAFESCKRLGLTTVADMKRYCREKLRSLGKSRPSFEDWANRLTQEAVNRIAMMGTASDRHAIERLRALGVIDDECKVVPSVERPARRAAHEERVRAEKARIEAHLLEQGIVRNDVTVGS